MRAVSNHSMHAQTNDEQMVATSNLCDLATELMHGIATPWLLASTAPT